MKRFNQTPITHPIPHSTHKSKSKSKKSIFKIKINEYYHFKSDSLCNGKSNCKVISCSSINDKRSSLKCVLCPNKWDYNEIKWKCTYDNCDNIFCNRCVEKDKNNINTKRHTKLSPKTFMKNKKRRVIVDSDSSNDISTTDEDYIKPSTPISSDISNNSDQVDIVNQDIQQKLSKFHQYSYSANRKKQLTEIKKLRAQTLNVESDSDESINGHKTLNKSRKRRFGDINMNEYNGNNNNKRQKKRMKINGNMNGKHENDIDIDIDIDIDMNMNTNNKPEKPNILDILKKKNEYIKCLENENNKLRKNSKLLMEQNKMFRDEGKRLVGINKQTNKNLEIKCLENEELRDKLKKIYGIFQQSGQTEEKNNNNEIRVINNENEQNNDIQSNASVNLEQKQQSDVSENTGVIVDDNDEKEGVTPGGDENNDNRIDKEVNDNVLENVNDIDMDMDIDDEGTETEEEVNNENKPLKRKRKNSKISKKVKDENDKVLRPLIVKDSVKTYDIVDLTDD